MCVSNLAHLIEEEKMSEIEALLLETDWDVIEHANDASENVRVLLASFI